MKFNSGVKGMMFHLALVTFAFSAASARASTNDCGEKAERMVVKVMAEDHGISENLVAVREKRLLGKVLGIIERWQLAFDNSEYIQIEMVMKGCELSSMKKFRSRF